MVISLEKMKRIVDYCQICKKNVQIMIPADLAQTKAFFPFPYIDIHGDPEHALMMFLDANLSVRNSTAFMDLKIAKEKGNEFAALNKMTETEAFLSIYSNPTRFQLYSLLLEGPSTENALLEALKKDESFNEANFSFLTIPLIKTGIVKSGWLKENFQECYYLTQDFLILRVPHRITFKAFQKDPLFSSASEEYFKLYTKTFTEYKHNYLSSLIDRKMLIQQDIKLLTSPASRKIVHELYSGPKLKCEVLRSNDVQALDDLVKKNVIVEFSLNNTQYEALLYDAKVVKFFPEQMIRNIHNKLQEKEITIEMARTHLGMLFEASA
jgi:hypothetical protein